MDAFNFLSWLRNPNLQNLVKLRKCIKSNDVDWMTEFLQFDGLGLLFQCLKNLGSYKGHHLSDMVLKLECIIIHTYVGQDRICLCTFVNLEQYSIYFILEWTGFCCNYLFKLKYTCCVWKLFRYVNERNRSSCILE
jgi:hypothetical protein